MKSTKFSHFECIECDRFYANNQKGDSGGPKCDHVLAKVFQNGYAVYGGLGYNSSHWLRHKQDIRKHLRNESDQIEKEISDLGMICLSRHQAADAYTSCGGKWLGAIRNWVQSKKKNGNTVTWASTEVLDPPMTVKELEDAADFRKSESTLFEEQAGANPGLRQMKSGECVLLVSKNGKMLRFVFCPKEIINPAIDRWTEVLESRLLRIRGKGGWNPLMLQNHAISVGLKLVGIKKFEEHYKNLSES